MLLDKVLYMTNLKKSLFWIAFYILIVLVLGQLDRSDRPIINFAAYLSDLVPCIMF